MCETTIKVAKAMKPGYARMVMRAQPLGVHGLRASAIAGIRDHSASVRVDAQPSLAETLPSFVAVTGQNPAHAAPAGSTVRSHLLAERIGRAAVTIEVGSLLDQRVGAIIAPQHLDRAERREGIGGQVERRGGSAANAAWARRVSEGPAPLGDALLTKLDTHAPFANVIVVATVSGGDNVETQFSTVYQAMCNALRLAHAAGIKSIATPLLCGESRFGRLTIEQSALAIASACKDMQQELGRIPNVKIMILEAAQRSSIEQRLALLEAA